MTFVPLRNMTFNPNEKYAVDPAVIAYIMTVFHSCAVSTVFCRDQHRLWTQLLLSITSTVGHRERNHERELGRRKSLVCLFMQKDVCSRAEVGC